MRHLEVMYGPRRHWFVRYEDDATFLSEHNTLAEAETEARSHARQFGVNVIHVYELDGEQSTIALEPDHEAPTPRDVKGPASR
jgi:hypothetical protein